MNDWKRKFLYKICVLYIKIGTFIGNQLINNNLAQDTWGCTHSGNIKKFVLDESVKNSK